MTRLFKNYVKMTSRSTIRFIWPYSKSKLELESNSNEILPVNCKFIRDSTPILSDKTQTWIPEICR